MPQDLFDEQDTVEQLSVWRTGKWQMEDCSCWFSIPAVMKWNDFGRQLTLVHWCILWRMMSVLLRLGSTRYFQSRALSAIMRTTWRVHFF